MHGSFFQGAPAGPLCCPRGCRRGRFQEEDTASVCFRRENPSPYIRVSAGKYFSRLPSHLVLARHMTWPYRVTSSFVCYLKVCILLLLQTFKTRRTQQGDALQGLRHWNRTNFGLVYLQAAFLRLLTFRVTETWP